MGLADKRCGQRIVSLLEGGYDLEALSKSASFHLDALMGREIGA
jgi:acetoin utilization deacetylase AcuC-like enzyme